MSSDQVELALVRSLPGAGNTSSLFCRNAARRVGHQREDVRPDASVIEIRQRVYQEVAALKIWFGRTIAIPPRLPGLLRDWMEKAVDQSPERTCLRVRLSTALAVFLLEDHIKASWNDRLGLGELSGLRRTTPALAIALK